MKYFFIIILILAFPHWGFNQHNTILIDSPNPELIVEINGTLAPKNTWQFINYPEGYHTIKLALPEKKLVTELKLRLSENDSVVICANLITGDVFPVYYTNFNDHGVNVSSSKSIFFVVEEMPVFRSDPDALSTYIDSQVVLEKEMLGITKKGKVFVQFRVNETGEVTFARIVKGVEPQLDLIALKIIWNLPQWESPGKQNGIPVVVAFTIPVKF